MNEANTTPSAGRSSLRLELLVGAVLFLVALCAPFLVSNDLIFLAGILWIQMVFGISWNLMFGYTGMSSFGHAAYFAVGAYTYAVLLQWYPGLSFIALMASVIAVAVIGSACIGFVALRRAQGIYFAILTLAVSQILYMVISSSGALGHDDGIPRVQRPHLGLPFLDVDLATGGNYYYALVLICFFLILVLWWVANSRIGRMFRSIQQDPDRAAFLGINVQAMRLTSFILASTCTAIAGALYGPWLQLVSPGIAHWSYSAQPVLYSLLGGVQFFWGPAVGAVIFSVLSYGTRTMQGLNELLIGGVLLSVVLVFPGGLLGLFRGNASHANSPLKRLFRLNWRAGE
jgi:branched-chain amino acid transport system permease protein